MRRRHWFGAPARSAGGVVTPSSRNGRIHLDNLDFGRSAGPLARIVADLALGIRADSHFTSFPDADIDRFDLDTDVRGCRIAVHIDSGGHAG